MLAGLAAGCDRTELKPPAAPRPPVAAYSPEPASNRGGTVVFGDYEFPQTLNPLTAPTETELRIANLLFAPLWALDPNLVPYPDLVRSVPSEANGGVKLGRDGRSMSIDVNLVPGLHWSDGQPLTVDDITFTIDAICDPAVGAADVAGFDRIRSMDRRSDTELVLTLGPGAAGRCGAPAEIPTGVYGAYQLLGPALAVLPRHRLEGVPRSNWAGDPFFTRPDVVSGPFVVGETAPGERVVLARNSRYADGRSAPGAYRESTPATHASVLDSVVFKTYPSRDALIAGLRAHESDVGYHLTPGDLDALRAIGGSAPVTVSGLEDVSLNPNHASNTATGRPPPWVLPNGTEDTAVLDALSRAVDRAQLVEDALRGIGAPARGLFPAALKAYADVTAIAPAGDADAARRMLEANGWIAGPGGVRAKGGRRLEFQLLTICDDGAKLRAAALIRQWFTDAGAAVQVDCRKRPSFLAGFGGGGVNATGAFDMTLYGNVWTPDPSSWTPEAEAAQIPSAQRPNGQNWNRCRDSRLEAAMAAGDGKLRADDRRAAYLVAQREWLAYACTIPLYEVSQVREVSVRLHGFMPGAMLGGDGWNAVDWWVAPPG